MNHIEIEARRRAQQIWAARQKAMASFAGLGEPADPTAPMALRATDPNPVGNPNGVIGTGRPMPTWPDTPTLIPEDGATVYNPEKDYQKVFYLRALGPSDAFPAVITNSLGSVYANCTVGAEDRDKGDFEVVKLMATSTSNRRFSVEISQPGVDRIFMNNPIPDNMIFGSSLFPSYLPETIYVPATSALRFKCTDLSGNASTNIRIVAWGRRFLDAGNSRADARRVADNASRLSHPFWLTFNDGSSVQLTGNATNQDYYMRVPNDARFECFGVLDDSDGAYNIEVFEGTSARSLTDGAMPARDFFASPSNTVTGITDQNYLPAASLPFVWPFTHVFQPSTNLRIRLSDTSGVTNNIRLCFVGRLVYYPKSKKS